MKSGVRSSVVCLALACAVFAQTPSVQEGGVLNAASFVPGQSVAPGSLISVFGTELAGALAQADSIPLSTSLGNVSVAFNGIKAPILFVSQGQINAQLPWNVLGAGAASGNVEVIVQRGSASSAVRTASVGAFSPGIFSTQFGTGQAIAITTNGLIAAAPGAIPGLTTEPARIGGTIVIYANGLGAVNNPVANGANTVDALRTTTTTPEVLIGGKNAVVAFSGLAPQFVGVNQLNVVIPEGTPTGDAVPLQLRVGGQTTSDKVTIAVR